MDYNNLLNKQVEQLKGELSKFEQARLQEKNSFILLIDNIRQAFNQLRQRFIDDSNNLEQ